MPPITYSHFAIIFLLTCSLLTHDLSGQTAKKEDLAEYGIILLDNGIVSEAGLALLTQKMEFDYYSLPNKGMPILRYDFHPDSVTAIRLLDIIAQLFKVEEMLRYGGDLYEDMLKELGVNDSRKLTPQQKDSLGIAFKNKLRLTEGYNTELALGNDLLDTTRQVRQAKFNWSGFPPPSVDVPLLVGKDVSVFGMHTVNTLEVLSSIGLIDEKTLATYREDLTEKGGLPQSTVLREIINEMGETLVAPMRRKERKSNAKQLWQEGYMTAENYALIIANDSILTEPSVLALNPFLKNTFAFKHDMTKDGLDLYQKVLKGLCSIEPDFCDVTISFEETRDTILQSDTVSIVSVCLSKGEKSVCDEVVIFFGGDNGGVRVPGFFMMTKENLHVFTKWQLLNNDRRQLFYATDLISFKREAEGESVCLGLFNREQAAGVRRLGIGMIHFQGPSFDTIFYDQDIELALDSLIHFGFAEEEDRITLSTKLKTKRPNSLIDILYLIPGVIEAGSGARNFLTEEWRADHPEGYWYLGHFFGAASGVAKLTDEQAGYLARHWGVRGLKRVEEFDQN